MDIKKILELHLLWLEGDKKGERANLNGADLNDANLRCANLRCANLRGADLRGADLNDANLRDADLRCANLRGADLRGANLRCANLRGADLRGANLSRADLRDADLEDADLRGANLRGADLEGANLSNSKGLKPANEIIKENFEFTKDGLIAYKTFNSQYEVNNKWIIEIGEYITETVNHNRQDECGCGVNVGTLDFVSENYGEYTIWKVLIEWKDLVGVTVPYNFEGKIRAERVKLLGKVEG